MAYNPFSIFRRNQKALFAVLTVFIMIMFTLSFGANDFFERASRWIGNRGRGEPVCKIDGDTIKGGELDRIRRDRAMANKFMTLAAVETAGQLQVAADQQQAKLSEEGRDMAGKVQVAKWLLSGSRFMGDPSAQQAIVQAKRAIEALLDNPNAKSEDRDAARMYQAQLNLIERRIGGEEGLFFVNAPNRTNRDAIEFLLWEKKADQLGIRFTKDDVVNLLNREFYGFFRRDVEVRKTMRESVEGFTMDACLDALGLEFKVRAAQAAVLGPSGKVAYGAPVFSTPYETFEFYRQQCSPATYEVIAVPALAFTDKVPGEPTDAEVRELYKKYANDEPNPAKETFGFKEPRKLAIQWLAITGKEPYYEKLAAEQVKVGEVMGKASGLMAVPLPGNGGWAAAAAAPLALKEPAVEAAYSEYTRDHQSRLFSGFGGGAYERSDLVARDILPTSVVRPGTLSALLGGMAGQSAPFGGPAVAVSLSMGAPIGYEVRDRVKFGLPLLLGTVPGPAMFENVVAGAAAAKLNEPKPLSPETMRPELIKTTVAGRASALAFGTSPGSRITPDMNLEKGDIARFTEELEKLSEKGKLKERDQAAIDKIEKYIADFKAARGLTKAGEQFGGTSALRSEWDIEDDPGLQPLVLAQKESLASARGVHGGDRYTPFGRSFFWGVSIDPMTGSQRRGKSEGVYLARPFPPQDRFASRDDGRPHYIYWATKDEQPKPTNLDSARPAVVSAWKRNKARELAQARANQIAEAIRSAPQTDAVLVPGLVSEQGFKFRSEIPLGNKGYFRAQTFPLANVCPLVPIDMNAIPIEERIRMLQQGVDMTGQLQRFGLAPTENIPYPTQEMVSALLDNREKAPKTVVVLPDAPKDTYYVATLVRRELKAPEEFKRTVYGPRGPARDAIFGLFQAESARKARESVVALLKDEFKYKETEEQKKKLDENAKSGGRD